MCALFGILDYGRRVPVNALQKLIQALANASEVRGTHASGISYVSNEKLTVYKRPKPAHKQHFRIPKDAAAVMGHTRYTTQGDQKHNYNNHPFRGYAGTDLALAHNGILYNDHSLRTEKKLPYTEIETDSYIAVQLIESEHELSFSSIRKMAEAVRGYFTFTILDENNRLYIVKGESPLYLLHFPTLGLYVYASTAEIMKNALQGSALQWLYSEEIGIAEGELLRICPDGSIEREIYTVHDDSAYWNHWYSSRIYDWDQPISASCSDDEDYLFLIRLSGYYGVDPEDIRYLREIGYSYDEIEDFLMDPESYGVELPCAEL